MAGKELTLEYLQEIIQAFNTRDADKIISYFAEDCIFYASRGPDVDGQAITGKEALRRYFAERFERIPDMHWESVYDHVYDGDRAVSVWIVTGTSADGEKLEHRGCDLWEFRDGLIWRKDTYWKWQRN